MIVVIKGYSFSAKKGEYLCKNLGFSLEEFGLERYKMGRPTYRVIDKQLFMLAVIKYGIQFEEIDINNNHE